MLFLHFNLALILFFADAKVTHFFEITKLFSHFHEIVQ